MAAGWSAPLKPPHTQAVPDSADRSAELIEGHGGRIEDDLRLFGSEVDRRLLNPGDFGERPLDAPDARGTGHPFNRQTDFA